MIGGVRRVSMQGIEALMCCPYLSFREVSWLLGDFVDGWLRPNPGYYPLLLFHVDTNGMDRGDLGMIKCVYRSPGPAFNYMGNQIVFDLFLPVRRKGIRRTQKILRVNSDLHSRCLKWGFRFYNHGTLLEGQQLLGRFRIQLTKWGNIVFPKKAGWTNKERFLKKQVCKF